MNKNAIDNLKEISILTKLLDDKLFIATRTIESFADKNNYVDHIKRCDQASKSLEAMSEVTGE